VNFYQGRFKPSNPHKYVGDTRNIIYRSSWELQALKWCDRHDSVVKYSSEEIIIPYISPADGKMHRYFPDLFIETSEGKRILVEIKPRKQTERPATQGKAKRQQLSEAVRYAVNQAKWQAASQYAHKKGWIFAVWTEHTLTKMGILKSSAPKPLKPIKKLKRKTSGKKKSV